MNSVPVRHSDSAEHRRLIAQTVNQLIPAVQDLTLTTSSTTTVTADDRVSADKTIVLVATNALAAAENTFITTGDKTFTITHASAGTTRTFKYFVIG
jgi:DeoR/GlpR family transcriptional regulator of sugar metabolism